jgi:preprotein translocase subunit SecA
VPLIISEPYGEPVELYTKINRAVVRLKTNEHYEIDEKSSKRGSVALTEEGVEEMQRLLGVTDLYDHTNMELVHHVNQSLIAQHLYQRDVDYLVEHGEVVLVDEFTGRKQPGRRLSEGLHQAIEAKERVRIVQESQTGASITYQNFFRMYEKLAGMTGTADTEAAEFAKIYNLDVNVIPTNRAMIRQDHSDVVYRTEKEKFEAIAQEVMEYHERGQPVLVGTISIEKSERLAKILKQRGVKHHVLNAKFHEKEAEIISQAGGKSAVTLATNMAGRGTDIILGGNPDALYKQQVVYRGEDLTDEQKRAAFERIQRQCELEKEEVLQLGGLHIIGTERHESRRIDNQLRGRSGRQGDPGASRFFLSLEDDLMRIFASERVSNLMLKLGMEEGVPIEHRMVSKSIENAQKKVEGHNFDIRKHILEYDDVMNKQREIIYAHRAGVLGGSSIQDDAEEWLVGVVDALIKTYCPEETYAEAWDLAGLHEAVLAQFGTDVMANEDVSEMGRDGLRNELLEHVQQLFRQRQAERDEQIGPELRSQLERSLVLQVIDHHWKDHLLGMDQMRDGIGLRGYGQKDPLAEYKREGFDMFAAMMDRIKSDALERLFKVQVVRGERPSIEDDVPPPPMIFNRGGDGSPSRPVQRSEAKVGRNEPCPCGSGKKYKKCHGA